MKLKIFIFLVALALIVSCKKSKPEEPKKIVSKLVYINNDWAIAYVNKEDIGLKAEDLKKNNKEFTYLKFANQVEIKDETNKDNKVYYNVVMPDGKKYWVSGEFVTEKFITINAYDVNVYSQPNDTYLINKIKLQPGDFGFLVEVKDEWLKVNFRSYRGSSVDDLSKNNWVGTVWIKNGYTDDFFTAKKAYFLYMAYYYELVKNDIEAAKKQLMEAKAITNITDIDQVIEDRLAKYNQ